MNNTEYSELDNIEFSDKIINKLTPTVVRNIKLGAAGLLITIILAFVFSGESNDKKTMPGDEVGQVKNADESANKRLEDKVTALTIDVAALQKQFNEFSISNEMREKNKDIAMLRQQVNDLEKVKKELEVVKAEPVKIEAVKPDYNSPDLKLENLMLTDKNKRLEKENTEIKQVSDDTKNANIWIKGIDSGLIETQIPINASTPSKSTKETVASDVVEKDPFKKWRITGLTEDTVVFSDSKNEVMMLTKGDTYKGVKIIKINIEKGVVTTSDKTLKYRKK